MSAQKQEGNKYDKILKENFEVVLRPLGKTKKIIYPSELFFFLYVSLNLPYVARLCASNLAKHIKKITSSFGVDYFLPLPLLNMQKSLTHSLRQQTIHCARILHRNINVSIWRHFYHTYPPNTFQ